MILMLREFFPVLLPLQSLFLALQRQYVLETAREHLQPQLQEDRQLHILINGIRQAHLSVVLLIPIIRPVISQQTQTFIAPQQQVERL